MHSLQYTQRKLSKMHEQISISYHEAGHAIIGLLGFMNILAVRISESEDGNTFEGFTSYDLLFNDTDIKDNYLTDFQLMSEISMFYAGLAAEKCHFKNASGSDIFPMILKMGSQSDIKEASKLIKKIHHIAPGSQRYNFKNKMMKATMKTLSLHWDAVSVVAHALFKKKKITTQELQKLLSTKTKDKEFWKSHFKKLNYFHNLKENVTQKELKDTLTYV